MEDPAPDRHGSRVLSHTSLADRGDPFRDHLYAREPWVLTPTHQQPNLGRRNKTCRFSRWRAGSHRRSWQRPRQTWMPRNPGFWSLRRRCSSPSEGGSRATRPAPRAAGSGREQKRHMPRAAEPRVLRVRESGCDGRPIEDSCRLLLLPLLCQGRFAICGFQPVHGMSPGAPTTTVLVGRGGGAGGMGMVV